MPGSFLNSSNETVRYKNLKNATDDEHNNVILIGSSNEEAGHSKTERKFPKLQYSFYLFTFLVVLICCVTLLIFYYEISSRNYPPNKNLRSNHCGHSCVAPHLFNRVFYVFETTFDNKGCPNNNSCHSFLDSINRYHNGSTYNFVIGPRGELYIGAGFKCLVNNKENMLRVKVLKSSRMLSSHQEHFQICYRISEIIDQGILCGKISPDFKTLLGFDNGSIIEENSEMCTGLERHNKNRWHHVHDPCHEVKLIHQNFGWSFCGNLSSTLNTKENSVITMDIIPEMTCSPMKLIDQIIVDIVQTPQLECSDVSSCLHTFEVHHDGLRYNFIISQNLDVYIGLGFNCSAENTSDNVLKVKVLNLPDQSYGHGPRIEIIKFLLIVEEGIACGRISEKVSVNVNCDIPLCEEYYMDINEQDKLKHLLQSISRYFGATPKYKLYNARSEHGRGIVPNEYRYQFCSRNNSQEVTKTNLTTEIKTYSDSSCNPVRVPLVQIETEKIFTDICSMDTICFSLVDAIEQNHNGLNYNFVIGPRGELYIGSGFKCLVNNTENTLKVKFLVSEESRDENDNLCSRLGEIIDHGILCGNLFQNYSVQFPTGFVCGFELGKNRTHHEHDPDQTKKFISENIRWTFCGEVANGTNKENDKVMENYLKTCLPLDVIGKIKVDVEETPPFNCSDDSSCVDFFEKDQNGLKYNFIIGHNQEVYVGLGFKCRAENTVDNVLKIKVYNPPNTLYELLENNNLHRYLQIVYEGMRCGRIAYRYIVESQCNVKLINEFNCRNIFRYMYTKHFILAMDSKLLQEDNYFRSEHRSIVSREYRTQLCDSNGMSFSTERDSDDDYSYTY